MEKVEYLKINSEKDYSVNIDWLNSYGKDGWIWLRTIRNGYTEYSGCDDSEYKVTGYTHIFYRFVNKQ